MNDKELAEVFNALEIDRSEVKAKAYGLTINDGTFTAKMIREDEDVYELIDHINDDKILANTSFDYFTLITHGWAAPLNKNGEVDGAPSKHPERRRVRLIVAVKPEADNDVASILQFSDEPDDLIFDYGTATGSLADAVLSLFE